ncbi:hypothetical protein LZ554_002766 [Drepanopeziza brunnea f. sp. 'monogermtubi']|nr:hypothetical protein LZ554_002766 [Drepanopeziza brunnea f. sp. 'monogermtubi']
MPLQFLQLPEHAMVTLLRQCYARPQCQALCRQTPALNSSRSLSTLRPQLRPRHRRPRPWASIHTQSSHEAQLPLQTSFSSTSPALFEGDIPGRGRKAEPAQIAVLGGGITGLASAHYLTKENPNAKITIYESSERLGGWLKSEVLEVEVEGKGEKVLFESGPRTLRPHSPAGVVVLELIQELGLEKDMLITQTTSLAHQNRFVYYPDHLVRMPGPGQDAFDMAWRLLTEPVFKGLAWGALWEFNVECRPLELEDESVGDFLTRRLGSENPGNNIVSAVLHGIYAGDIYQLSVKSLLPLQWAMEGWKGSLSKAMLAKGRERLELVSRRDIDLRCDVMPKINVSMLDALKTASVYSFKEGIGSLSEALVKSLKANPNVDFKLGAGVTAVEFDGESESVTISTSSRDSFPAKYTKAISTLSSRVLSTLTSTPMPTLAQTHSVTVMVVNLYYPDPHILPERGFGYLIPRSVPFEQNPECALGVVFDSDAVQGQDTASGTKVTVMLGGHWWDSFSTYPDEEEGVNMARAVLHRHLKITGKPVATRVSLQRECIPQYTVGHEKRLREAHLDLMTGFKGKLAVAGNSYTGVGLNDCVRAARDVVIGMKRGNVITGLENFGRNDIYVPVSVPSPEELPE